MSSTEAIKKGDLCPLEGFFDQEVVIGREDLYGVFPLAYPKSRR